MLQSVYSLESARECHKIDSWLDTILFPKLFDKPFCFVSIFFSRKTLNFKFFGENHAFL